MKIKLLFITIVFSAFAKNITAQTAPFSAEDVTGVYTTDSRKTLFPKGEGDKTYTGSSLTLSLDGRYEYHNYRQLDGQLVENLYSHGNWILKGKVIYFTSSSEDIDEKYTMNLNNSKARFFKQSPRSKSLATQPTYLQFFSSEYAVIRGLKLLKTNE